MSARATGSLLSPSWWPRCATTMSRTTVSGMAPSYCAGAPTNPPDNAPSINSPKIDERLPHTLLACNRTFQIRKQPVLQSIHPAVDGHVGTFLPRVLNNRRASETLD